MKKTLVILCVLGVGALIAFLAVTKNMAENRATRLDRALLEAETRIMELESELQAQASTGGAPAPSKPSPAQAAEPATPSAASQTPAAQPTASPATPGVRVLFASTTGSGVTNLVRIEGTSTVHDWQVEGHLIGGSVEFPAGFPAAGQPPAALDAKASVFIPVRSLKSVERSGAHYSDAMDEIMYGKLLAEQHKRITYTLTSLAPKAQSDTATAEYEATGQLTVAGVTKPITMPVSIVRAPDGRIRIAGSVGTKMTTFGITPPAPSVGGLSIKTGDEVTLRFEWWVKPAK